MVETPRNHPPSVRAAEQKTEIRPLAAYALALLASWSLWALFVYPLALSTVSTHPVIVGVVARLVFWGAPSALYLNRYWGRRALEPLGLTFPLGASQRLRTLLISIVVALCLLVGTATQAGVSAGELAERLLKSPSLDLTAPVMEELVFRGIVVAELLNWTHDSSRSGAELRLKFWGGQLAAAGLFVLVHWPFWISHLGTSQALQLSLPVLVTGLILGFVFATTRSIWGCIFLHWLNNALSQLT